MMIIRFDGVSNYIPWKVIFVVVLKEMKIWSFANAKMTKPVDKGELEEFESLEARAQRVIVNIV